MISLRHGLRVGARTSSTAATTRPQTFLHRRPLLSSLIASTFITTSYGYKYLLDELGSTEGLQRAMSFYSLGIPTYLKYRYLLAFHPDNDSLWDSAHKSASLAGLEKIKELRGFYIKTGQMCATNIGNAFPQIWQQTMSVLQDGVPPKPMSVVKDTIEKSFNIPFDSVFKDFDPTPLGAASIGQVHRATLLNGEKVVVKVQYPEVERQFRGDVRTLIVFCKFAQPVHVPGLEEIEKQFMTEFDYVAEALQLMTVRNNLVKGGIVPSRCEVPRPYFEYCTKDVLVMEELAGKKMVEALEEDADRYVARLGKRGEELAKSATVGPSRKAMDVYIAAENWRRQYRNVTGLFTGHKWEGRETLPINHARMVDEMIDVHGHEIFVDGYFNGDPHPGNVLLLDADKGKPRLGLIDYGQVKKLSREQIVILSKMMVALQEEDDEEIAKLIFEAGYITRDSRPDLAAKYARVTLDVDNKSVCNGKHVQVFLEEIQALDPVVDLPRDFVMVARVSLMLRGLGHALKQPRRMSDRWLPFARRVLAEEARLKKENPMHGVYFIESDKFKGAKEGMVFTRGKKGLGYYKDGN